MNRKHKKRLVVVLSVVALCGVALGLVLFALKQNINLFYTPTELLASHVKVNESIRIGGYVENHSVRFAQSGRQVQFFVTDKKNHIAVNYAGILPNLFREGQGVVIEGKVNARHVFIASQVLAKHDEKYMPRVLQKVVG